MKLPMTNRLLTCCSFVHPGDRVIDVGTDHGYLGIHLLSKGIAQSVIASDIAEGPLTAATVNAAKYGFSDRMHFYLSDGLRSVPRDFDCMVCAGMGADTMMGILDAAQWLKERPYRLILQCQSRVPALREYLSREGYAITRETLAKDGKFLYSVMDVVYAPDMPRLTPADCWLSPALRDCGSDLLAAYCDRVLQNLSLTVRGMSRSGADASAFREIHDQIQIWREQIHG